MKDKLNQILPGEELGRLKELNPITYSGPGGKLQMIACVEKIRDNPLAAMKMSDEK